MARARSTSASLPRSRATISMPVQCCRQRAVSASQQARTRAVLATPAPVPHQGNSGDKLLRLLSTAPAAATCGSVALPTLVWPQGPVGLSNAKLDTTGDGHTVAACAGESGPELAVAWMDFVPIAITRTAARRRGGFWQWIALASSVSAGVSGRILRILGDGPCRRHRPNTPVALG